MAALLLAVASCAAPPATQAPPAAPARPSPPPAPATPAPPRRPAPPAASDSCGATKLQYLVGKPRTDIPIPLVPSRRRVLCSTCPITRGYESYRQTIIYDSQTGLVRSVTCG
ncbi:MAG TPA: proteinase inhibitor i78 [Caulobacteraceae bacterium]|nr:proteinase inhibitor i78 [Caulobacteraceae bacterium]